ncbi:tetratricopeptide repeat protein [uncultured Aquimarina sp.]|uniref:tetratricopeptide repeat protein n=1 Tax=uncultured Aquimarina sp. TaxID=575652 RepID=UPI00262D911A|nr:tetratricopeptide repeat protein [uncultured Aquimarina sp.]
MTTETKKTLIKDLWERKVPQYLGTYFALGFGLLQFVEFITNRYNLSEFWVDKYFLVWLALIPAIAIIAYFSGQLNPSSKSRTLKWPKLLVIGNISIALLLGALLFNGEAIAQSEVVELTDEEGNEVRAVVPSLHKVKTIACFQFENLTGDTEQDWWGVAFSNLLQFNLDQRPEFYAYSAYSLNSFYDVVGLTSFTVPNVGMQREIAQKSRNDYFSRISYTKEGNKFIFKGNVYNTKDAKSIINIKAEDEDPYAAIDKIKEQILADIPNALKDAENEISLPASTLITSDQEALKNFTLSRIAYYKNPAGLNEVLSITKKAVELDPTCSQCHYYVGDVLYGLGNRDEAILYIKKSIKYAASLPERMQFGAKGILYAITNNMDAYLKLQELHRKMYPYDFLPYNRLLSLYKSKYGIDRAKELIQEAIAHGNLEKGLLTMYSLQLENEEYDEAVKTLDRFIKEFPDRDQDKVKYATIYERQGKLKEAREILLEEETIDPLNTDIQRRLAYLDYRDLDIVKATERVEQGIEQATTLTDSLRFFSLKMHFLRMSGQIEKALSILDTVEKYEVRRTPVNRVISSTFTAKADMYQSIGNSEKIPDLLENIAKYSPESVSRYACQAASSAIQRGFDSQMDKEKFADCNEHYKSYGEGYNKYFDLIVAYQSQDYDTCSKILKEDDGRIKGMFFEKYFLASVYNKIGNIEKVKEILQTAIDQKDDDAIYYYQMAALLEKEDANAAKKYLNIALQFWSNADDNFIPLQRANELAQRLNVL